MNTGNTHDSICSSFLTLLKVPHTACFTDEKFRNSPYAGTLRGFQDLLSEYDVASELRHFDDKNAIDSLSTPFVAMMLGKLVVVTKITTSSVTVVDSGKSVEMPRADFVKKWNGKALFATPNAKSSEPAVENHRRLQAMILIRRWGIVFCLAVIFLWLFIDNKLYTDVGTILVTIFDMAGIYVCYLLLGKQLHISSKRADAMCGFLQKGGCGKIMERNVSKIFGVIGWGEVGMAYFSVSLIALLLYPPCIGYLAFFNACCLPYTVWSISYQKFVAKTWCTLCVTVQTLQWLLFGSYLLADAWHGLWPLHTSLFILGFGYLLALLLIDRLLPVVGKAHELQTTKLRYDNMRLRADIFAVEQSQQPETAPMHDATGIIFGDPSATPKVVIFSDAMSEKAADIFREVDSLLKKGMTVGYTFNTSSPDSLQAAKNIVALYLASGADKCREAMAGWFALKQKDPAYFKQYALDTNAPAVTAEIAKEKKWQTDSYLYASPTIIVDGRILNDIYTLTDIIYIY